MLFPGLRFVLDKILAAAEAEMRGDSSLRERLLEAQMRLELGEIDEAEFAAIERDIVARMREISGGQSPLTMSPGERIAGVEIETFDSEETGGERTKRRSGGVKTKRT